MKTKSHFMTGYNAGSRHAKFGTAPGGFTLDDKSIDYRAGYKMGEIDRSAGKLTDNNAATGAIETAWQTYQSA